MSLYSVSAIMLQWLTVVYIYHYPQLVTFAYTSNRDWHRAAATAGTFGLAKAFKTLQTSSLHSSKDFVKCNSPYSTTALRMERNFREDPLINLVGNVAVEIPCEEDEDTLHDFADLDIIEFEGILNFRSALPGTGLPIYRCAALDNATSSDAVRLLTSGLINSSTSSDNKWDSVRYADTDTKRDTGLNICTIIDLRNTDEIVAAYKYRTYEGAVSLYSFFRIVLDTATSLRMKASTKTFYARTFDSVVRDLHYSAASTSYFADGLYQSSPSSTMYPPRSGRAGGVSKPLFQPRKIFELPLFGESEDFWVELKSMTVEAGPRSIMADLLWVFDPKALNTKLSANLASGGLPLLYEVLLEVSSRRIFSALFLCLVVTEDYSSFLEKEKELSLNDKDADAQGPVIPRAFPGGLLFHCAQGKDRTGILSMLLCFALYGDSPEVENRAVAEYAASERLLRRGKQGADSGDDSSTMDSLGGGGASDRSSDNSKESSGKEGNTNLGEIQSLKGSPPKALRDTLSRMRTRHGGVLGYLDSIGFGKDFRKRFRVAVGRSRTLTSEIRQIREAAS